ncbi:MAG: hypothetical protein A4E40_00220 [Methanoregulaceae archaeon PtaU1.Bin059]|nr:MAG: hypothetical protein A4E39_00662 [Methanoregulaceae archaeon PtaB.Bin152]OPY43097.1 MAG: hypothetical protein A4E40_00220 [Methanoregulaceae archaeon PtaU1.Bin059]
MERIHPDGETNTEVNWSRLATTIFFVHSLSGLQNSSAKILIGRRKDGVGFSAGVVISRFIVTIG